MEPYAVKTIEGNKDIQVGVLIMDDDTTTASKLCETLNHPFVKWSDLNQTRNILVIVFTSYKENISISQQKQSSILKNVLAMP